MRTTIRFFVCWMGALLLAVPVQASIIAEFVVTYESESEAAASLTGKPARQLQQAVDRLEALAEDASDADELNVLRRVARIVYRWTVEDPSFEAAGAAGKAAKRSDVYPLAMAQLLADGLTEPDGYEERIDTHTTALGNALDEVTGRRGRRGRRWLRQVAGLDAKADATTNLKKRYQWRWKQRRLLDRIGQLLGA